MEVQSRGISFHPMFIHSPPSLLWQVFEDKGHSCLFVSETAVTHVPDTGTQQTKERERKRSQFVSDKLIYNMGDYGRERNSPFSVCV